jgi:Xaa-Pro aminopeptidase
MQYGRFAVDYEYRPYNPERMRNERVARAQAALKKWGLGAMILYDYDYHRYLGYYSFHQYARRRLGAYVLLIQGQGFPYVAIDHVNGAWETPRLAWFEGKMVLKTSRVYHQLEQGLPDAPDFMPRCFDETAAEIKSLLKKHDVLDMPVGIDISSVNMLDACKRAGITVVDGNNCMADAIRIKTQDEIHCLRMAGVIAEAAHWEVCKALRPGMTELEIAGVAANACYKHGAEELEGPSFVVCTGERSGHGVPNMPTDRMLRPGDMVVLDINGVSFQGYRTCFYRTYLVGDKPTEFQKEVYSVCYEAWQALTDCMKPGITTADAQREWLKKGDAPGLWGRPPKWPEPGRYFFGSVVHPIGLRSGDPGATVSGASGQAAGEVPPGKLEPNMTFAVEAGCFTWLGDRWAKDGVKIEHCGVIKEDGFESFYRFPSKELIVCGLPGVY